jgi:hypothetical protein
MVIAGGAGFAKRRVSNGRAGASRSAGPVAWSEQLSANSSLNNYHLLVFRRI